jgi:hypothetical protein
VKFPSARLWQICVASALDVLPDETRSAEKEWTLTAWRTSGELVLAPIQHPGSLTFQGSPYSFASAMLNEVQLLLDHAAEHRVMIHSNVSTNQVCSPSWLFVTTYYWALFAALAFVRLQGKAAWYLDKQSLKTLVAGTPMRAPSGGTYMLEAGTVQGSARRDFNLKQSSDRFHEATWKLVTELMKPHLDRVTSVTTSGETDQLAEISIFRCLVDDPFRTPNWPSTLRNAINYRPGFTYQSVHGVDLLDNYAFFRDLVPNGWESISTEYLAIARGISKGSEPDGVLEPATKLLSLKALMLGDLTTNLLNQVIVERRMDRRWGQKRDRFLRSKLPNDGHRIWPFAAV